MILLLLALAACSGEGTGPAPAPSPAVAPATPAPAPVAAPAEVGPDGPSAIAIPADIPKTSAELPMDEATLARGEAVYTAKGCAACHQFGSKLVGPDLVGVGDRRTPPWIARMIARPEIMIKDDPVARKLYGEMMTPMANQGVAEADLLPLIAYISHKGAP